MSVVAGVLWLMTSAPGAPAPEVPAAEAPAAEVPATDAPASDAPATETAPTAASAGPEPLHLREVIKSALERHPVVRQADSAVDEKRAGRLIAQGAYDPKLKGEAGLNPLGYYERRRAKVGFAQALPVLGSPEVFGGWRNGADWESYEGKNVTGTFGELEAGVRLQLMQGLFIDPGRYGLRVAQLEQAQAEAKRSLTTLKLSEQATKAYLKWVVMHQQLQIARDLMGLAESRQDFLTRQVEAGALPRIALVDNRRQILSRRGKVVDLERKTIAATLELGLYLRDEDGQPLRPRGDRAPPLEVLIDHLREPPLDVLPLVERALVARPEIDAFTNARGVLLADLELATNDALPSVQLELVASQDLGMPQSYGPSSSRPETEAQTRLSMSWPVLLRKARGKMGKARAQLRALDAEVDLVEDVIRQEVEAAHASVLAAYQRVLIVRDVVDAAHQLEAAERAKLLAGSSDLLSVNLREERAAKSAEELAEALADYQMAVIMLQLRQGTLPFQAPGKGSPSAT